MRYLALDVGERRVGLAVSDMLNITAQGLCTYVRRDDGHDIERLCEIAREYAPCELVFGLPRNMDGSTGFQAEAVRAFADEICGALGCPGHFVDERLTSVSAHRILTQGDVRGKKRKAAVDKIAAVLILESFLEGR